MAVKWLEKRLPKKGKELGVHKVFFTGLSKEEKKESFENNLEPIGSFQTTMKLPFCFKNPTYHLI